MHTGQFKSHVIIEHKGQCMFTRSNCVFSPCVLRKVHLLVIERVEGLVVVDQVVPEFVVLGGLAAK